MVTKQADLTVRTELEDAVQEISECLMWSGLVTKHQVVSARELAEKVIRYVYVGMHREGPQHYKHRLTSECHIEVARRVTGMRYRQFQHVVAMAKSMPFIPHVDHRLDI